jgi:hypothetical protein
MFEIKTKDFTYYKYEKLIKSIIVENIPIYTIIDWHNLKPNSGIVIRHDIDRRVKNALDIAELEYIYGIKSTYYFRKTKNSFNPEIIKKIADMGHEIGYHYEDLSLANGNYEKAKKLFSYHLTKLRNIASVETCAMHGRPFSKYDNRDIWKSYKLEDFGLEAEAFLSINYTDCYYYTDTGRSWADNSANIRDKVATNKKADVSSTDELINFIKNNKNQKIAIVAHPERWAKNLLNYLYSQIYDQSSNKAKMILSILRGKNGYTNN